MRRQDDGHYNLRESADVWAQSKADVAQSQAELNATIDRLAQVKAEAVESKAERQLAMAEQLAKSRVQRTESEAIVPLDQLWYQAQEKQAAAEMRVHLAENNDRVAVARLQSSVRLKAHLPTDLEARLTETESEAQAELARAELAQARASLAEIIAENARMIAQAKAVAGQAIAQARAQFAEDMAKAQQIYVVRFTPMKLRDLLISIFEEYRNKNLPSAFKEDPEVAAVPSSNLGWGAYFKRGLAKAASATALKTRSHTMMTQFVEREMTLLLSSPNTSCVKTMTDMSILFHGLCEYISTRNSRDLKPTLLSIHIWPMNHPCEIAFKEQFKAQISLARELISANASSWDQQKSEMARKSNNLLQAVDIPYGSSEIGHPEKAPVANMGDIYNQLLETLSDADYRLPQPQPSVLDDAELDNQHLVL